MGLPETPSWAAHGGKAVQYVTAGGTARPSQYISAPTPPPPSASQAAQDAVLGQFSTACWYVSRNLPSPPLK